MTDEQLKKYWEMYTDGWKLFKEFAESDNSDEANKKYFAKVAKLDEKHGKSNLLRGIVLATQEELDRLTESKRRENES